MSTKNGPILFLCLALVWAMVLPGAAATQTDVKAPRIVIPEPVYNFKTVVEGEAVIHKFIIQNKGDVPLNIQKIHTG